MTTNGAPATTPGPSRSGDSAQKTAPLKLVVATSFSPKSALALDFALTYSQTFNADVYLFHVVDKKTTSFREADRHNEELMVRMRELVTASVERLHKRGITHSVERVHRRLSNGKPYTEMLRIVAGINADMLVMGQPKDGAFKKLITQCPCSIVLLKEKDPSFVIE